MIAMKKHNIYPKAEAVYEFVDLTKESKKHTPKKPSKDRASLNLEMALLIMLLALAVVFGLQIVGGAINDTFLETAGALGIAGGSFEGTLPDSTNNGDGTYTIGWEGGDAPFDVIEDGSVIADDTTPPFTYTPAPGVHEIIIRDSDGDLSAPITVVGLSPIVSVSAGVHHTVGIRSDGSVVAVGLDNFDQVSGVSSWSDITAISAGTFHTVGLRSDGSVVAVGDNGFGQCDVSTWTDIVAISAGDYHTVGVRSDGSVVAVGYNTFDQCDVEGWSDIVAISAGNRHTVGIRSDGSVVAVGYYFFGQCDVSGWSDIVAISAGGAHTVGLRSDGSVVAVGDNTYGQSDVEGW